MAESPIITTTLVVVPPPIASLIVMDPFWRPGAVGNGRIWISGRVANGASVHSIEYNVNNRGWTVAKENLVSDEKFGFYITGNEPSDWGTVIVTEFYQPSGTLFVAPQISEKPKLLQADSHPYREVFDIGDMPDDDRTWFWEEETHTLYFRNVADIEPDSMYAIIDPIFEQGIEYDVQIRIVDETDQALTLYHEQFVWPYQVRNYVDRYLNNLLPTYAQNSPEFRKIYTVLAKQAADKYAMFDDCIAQFLIDFTTWGITLWEKQLGLPSIPSIPLETRRTLLRARRASDSSREGFFNSILAVAPGAIITESYDIYRVDIKLTGVVDTGLRRAVESVIQAKKPIGIRVVVSYSQFIAGISLAGDSL